MLNPLLLPKNAGLIARKTKALIDARAGKTDEERTAFLVDSYAKGKEAEYASIREESFNISVLPNLVGSEIFELKPLLKDGRIMIRSTKNAEYQVRTVDHHANAPRTEWIFKDSHAMYDVYEFATDIVEYPRTSLIQGDLNAVDDVNRDVAFAYANEIDLDVWTLWLSIFDTFPSGTYDRHSRVNSGNLPTTNVINASGEGAITVEVMKQLLEHLSLLGRQARTIYLSPQDKADIWDWTPVAVASGSVGNVIPDSAHEGIFNSGQILKMFGYNINWKTVNTLATGTMYVTTDQPSGSLYYKPDLEVEDFVSQDIMKHVYKKNNYEGLGMRGAIKPLVATPERLNSVKVIFA